MQRTLFCTRVIKTLTPSESNHSTTAALLPLTLHRRSCHMLRFGLHMPLQGTSERRPRALREARLTYSLPSLPRGAICTTALCFNSCHAAVNKKPNFSLVRFSALWPGNSARGSDCLSTAAPAWRAFQVFRRRQCALAMSAKQTVVNGGEASSRRRIPKHVHTAQHPPTTTPLEAHIHVRRNSVQLSNPHNAELWRETPNQTQTSNCRLFVAAKSVFVWMLSKYQ